MKLLLKIRHGLVKLLAPRLYLGHLLWEQYTVRPSCKFVQDQNKRSLWVAEVGVRDGRNAENILKTLDVKMLFLVDPYEAYVDGDGKTKEFIREKQQAVDRMLCKPIFFNCSPSPAAASYYSNRYFDYVYIDANHSYEAVKADLAAWFPKVKSGGVLGGHDFWGRFIGVVRAVLEFAEENDLELHTDQLDWWFVKP